MIQDTGYRLQDSENDIGSLAPDWELSSQNGQSIVEYSVLFAAIVAVMIAAIVLPNSPIRTSLNWTFRDLIYTIGTSVNGVMP